MKPDNLFWDKFNISLKCANLQRQLTSKKIGTDQDFGEREGDEVPNLIEIVHSQIHEG